MQNPQEKTAIQKRKTKQNTPKEMEQNHYP